MGQIADRLKEQQFEEDIIKFIKDTGLTYSKVDKAYQTNESVNYSIWSFQELVDAFEIRDPDKRKLFAKLLKEHTWKAKEKFDSSLVIYRPIGETTDEN